MCCQSGGKAFWKRRKTLPAFLKEYAPKGKDFLSNYAQVLSSIAISKSTMTIGIIALEALLMNSLEVLKPDRDLV